MTDGRTDRCEPVYAPLFQSGGYNYTKNVKQLCFTYFLLIVLEWGTVKRFQTPSNYYWPSNDGTFVVVSFVLCSVLFNF